MKNLALLMFFTGAICKTGALSPHIVPCRMPIAVHVVLTVPAFLFQLQVIDIPKYIVRLHPASQGQFT